MTPQLLTMSFMGHFMFSFPNAYKVTPALRFSLFLPLPHTPHTKLEHLMFSKHSMHFYIQFYYSCLSHYNVAVCVSVTLGYGCLKGLCLSLSGCSTSIEGRNIDSEVENYMLNAIIAVVSHSLVFFSRLTIRGM